MHEVEIFEQHCHECSQTKTIVYIETYLTFNGRIGLYHCKECANKRTDELKDGKCIVIRKD